ncbi:MAG: TPM domain-containing protein [Formosimonas sp.]
MKHFAPLQLSFGAHCQRLLRHWLTFSYRTHRLLPADAREQLAQHIEQSELNHTGEIAIAFETRLPFRYLTRQACARERAWAVFAKMQVWDTPHNCGVLIYFLVAEKRIEIVADRGLASLIEQSQWDAWIHALYMSLQKQQLKQGLTQVIAELDAILTTHFPQNTADGTENRVINVPHIL